MTLQAELKKLITELRAQRGDDPLRKAKPGVDQLVPQRHRMLLSAIAAAGDQAGTEVGIGGQSIRLSTSSHASCKLEIAFERTPSRAEFWYPIVPGGKLTPPHGGRFEAFRVRKQTGTPSTSNAALFIIDSSEDGSSADESPQTGNVSSGGRTETKMGLTDATGAEADVIGTSHGAVAVAGFDGADYQRVRTDTSGRPIVVGAAAAGAAAAGNPVQVGGSDGTNARALKTSTTGALKTSVGFGVDSDDTPVQIAPTASNGATGVDLVAAVALQEVRILTLLITTDAARTVYLMSNATTRYEIYLPGAGTFVLDGRGDLRTAAGEKLAFKLDGGTNGTRISGTAVQK